MVGSAERCRAPAGVQSLAGYVVVMSLPRVVARVEAADGFGCMGAAADGCAVGVAEAAGMHLHGHVISTNHRHVDAFQPKHIRRSRPAMNRCFHAGAQIVAANASTLNESMSCPWGRRAASADHDARNFSNS
jgi:hypothetical protein